MADRKFTDLEIERYVAGDLPASRVAAIDASPADRARVDALRADNAAFLASVDVAAEVRAIGRTLGAMSPEPRGLARWWRWITAGGVFAAAATVLLVVVLRGGERGAPDDDLSIKGDAISLIVHAETRRLASGDSVRPGDRIRFEIVAAKPGFVAVIGVDGSGAPTVYAPYGGAQAAPFDPAARVLPGAIELDATPGDEHVFAFYSEQPFSLGAAISATLARDRLPAGLQVAEVTLRKQ